MIKTNLNIDLFGRKHPKTKYELVKNATAEELFNIKPDFINLMIKKAGQRIEPNHVKKELFLDKELANNGSNSSIISVYQGEANVIYLKLYIQGYDTDLTKVISLQTFLDLANRTLGTFTEYYSHSIRPQTIYANYSFYDKTRVLRAICYAYIKNKYNYPE